MEIINYFDVDEDGLLKNGLVLVGFFIAMRFLAFLALKIKVISFSTFFVVNLFSDFSSYGTNPLSHTVSIQQ